MKRWGKSHGADPDFCSVYGAFKGPTRADVKYVGSGGSTWSVLRSVVSEEDHGEPQLAGRASYPRACSALVKASAASMEDADHWL